MYVSPLDFTSEGETINARMRVTGHLCQVRYGVPI